MKHFLIITFITLAYNLSVAQSYPFVHKKLKPLTEAEMAEVEIQITPEVKLFNEQGQLLSPSQLNLMTNPNYQPIFFADRRKRIKTVVFKRKSSAPSGPVVIEKNPEAQFTKGELARDFIVTDLKGNTIKLSDLRGKVVVLNFWFTKCPPCVQEIPDLNALTQDFAGKDVVFIAITFNTTEVVQQFLNSTPFNYTIAPNANHAIGIYGVQSYPTNMVINKNGEIVLKDIGYRTNMRALLTKTINSLL